MSERETAPEEMTAHWDYYEVWTEPGPTAKACGVVGSYVRSDVAEKRAAEAVAKERARIVALVQSHARDADAQAEQLDSYGKEEHQGAERERHVAEALRSFLLLEGLVGPEEHDAAERERGGEKR